MKPATPAQIKAINSILAKRGLLEDKAPIIKLVTADRTTHSSELYFEEAKNLLSNLLDGVGYQPKNKMIAKIFAMAHEMGWITERQGVDPQGRIETKKDYSHVYNWIKKFGFGKKDLKSYKYNEIPKLLTQFEQGPYQSYLKNL
jgi:hypothetical protein